MNIRQHDQERCMCGDPDCPSCGSGGPVKPDPDLTHDIGRQEQIDAGVIICKRCGDPKSADQFYRDKHKRNGHKANCKDCECDIYLGRKARKIGELMQSWGVPQ